MPVGGLAPARRPVYLKRGVRNTAAELDGPRNLYRVTKVAGDACHLVLLPVTQGSGRLRAHDPGLSCRGQGRRSLFPPPQFPRRAHAHGTRNPPARAGSSLINARWLSVLPSAPGQRVAYKSTIAPSTSRTGSHQPSAELLSSSVSIGNGNRRGDLTLWTLARHHPALPPRIGTRQGQTPPGPASDEHCGVRTHRWRRRTEHRAR